MREAFDPELNLGFAGGTNAVIRHAYTSALDAAARLHSFATGTAPGFFDAIYSRQEVLAVDDLISFAIHSRRLIELTVGKEMANRHPVPLVGGDLGAQAPLWRIINIIVHHRTLSVRPETLGVI